MADTFDDETTVVDRPQLRCSTCSQPIAFTDDRFESPRRRLVLCLLCTIACLPALAP